MENHDKKVYSEKYLTFCLKDEEYGIPILRVKEIIGMMNITNMPKMPKAIKGVINLRGMIIPIMDLRLKFEMDEKEYSERTCIIVIELEASNKEQDKIGIVVDAVSEVINLTDSNIEESPSYEDLESDKYVKSIGKLKDKVIMLLDIDKVVKLEEIYNITDGGEKDV